MIRFCTNLIYFVLDIIMYRVLGFVIFNIIPPMVLSLFVFSPYYFIRWALFNMFLYYFVEYSCFTWGSWVCLFFSYLYYKATHYFCSPQTKLSQSNKTNKLANKLASLSTNFNKKYITYNLRYQIYLARRVSGIVFIGYNQIQKIGKS
jgi:hypothetical protein